MMKLTSFLVALAACGGTANFQDPAPDASPDVAKKNDASIDSGTIHPPTHAGKAWAFGESGTRLYFDGTSWSLDGQSTEVDAATPLRLLDAWASDDSLWVVGSEFTIMRFHAGAWETLPSPKGVGLDDAGIASDTGIMTSVWGTRDDDVWVSEQDLAPNSRPFLHWDGTKWTRSVETSGTLGEVTGLSGAAQNDIWAAGSGAVTITLDLWHYDGTSWTKSPTTPATTIIDEPGFLTLASNDVWLGAMNDVWHWDGTTWTSAYHAAGYSFRSFFGTKDDLWATSKQNMVHFDGTKWTPSPTKVTASTLSVGGTSTHDMWAVGDDGVAAHYDADGWIAFDTGTTQSLEVVIGVSDALGK